MTSNALVVRSTVRELVRTWQDCEAQIRTDFASLVATEERLNAAFVLGGSSTTGHMRIDASGHGYHDHFDDPDRALLRLRQDVWRVLAERLELQRLLSVSRWQELQRLIKDNAMPDITEDNVLAFAQGHADNLGEILRESVREVFDWLRPRRQTYKTNNLVEVGHKVVLPYHVEPHWTGGGFRVTCGYEQHLVAMENVFSSLDGRGQVAKTYRGELGDAIAAAPDGRGQTRYFRFRCFKNRNLHLEFLRRDLLARFNAIAGGAHLRPASTDSGRGEAAA